MTFSASAGTAITVSDPAIGNGQDTVFVQALGGTLTASNTAALASVSGNGASLVALTGTLAALNDALSGLTYVPPTHFNGSTGLSALLVPNSGPDTSAFVPLDFGSGPTVHLPAVTPSVNADLHLTFSAATGNAISVSDPNNFGGAETILVQVSAGFLALVSDAGLSAVSGDDTSLLEITGTLAQINAALDGLVYFPTTRFQGQEYLSVTVIDYAAALPVSVSVSASTPIIIYPGNFAPTIDGPHTQEFAGTGLLSFSPANGNAITLIDPDSGGGIETIDLETNTGSLAVLNTAGLTSIKYVQSPVYSILRFVEITGTVPALNAALDGLEYQAPAGTTTDFLAILVGDNGHTGFFAQTSEFLVQLTAYGYTDIAPTVTGAGFQAFSGAGATFSQGNGNAIHIADGDANGRTETAYVQVAGGTLTVANGISLGVSGNGTSHLTITSTVAIINAALDGLHYTPANTDAPDFLNVLVGDGARAGSLVAILGFDSATTLAPIVALPATQTADTGTLFAFSENNSNAIHLAAGDANGAIESVVVQVLQGRLEVGNTSGLATITGNGSTTLIMTGTLAALNAALDGLEYAPPKLVTTDFLNVAFGNNGSGGGPTRYTFAGLSIGVFPAPDNSAPAD